MLFLLLYIESLVFAVVDWPTAIGHKLLNSLIAAKRLWRTPSDYWRIQRSGYS